MGLLGQGAELCRAAVRRPCAHPRSAGRMVNEGGVMLLYSHWFTSRVCILLLVCFSASRAGIGVAWGVHRVWPEVRTAQSGSLAVPRPTVAPIQCPALVVRSFHPELSGLAGFWIILLHDYVYF